ncbi:MAG: Holliday junction resolvase RuvX [Bacilli bacterium]|nr:Holliday junction resolvase RuvX [Bacilli bacterium]
MRFMGLDLGSKTLGVALSDPSGIIASAIGTFSFAEGNYLDAINKTLDMIISHNVELVVLGHPRNMDGSLGFQAKIAENFKRELELKTKVQVVLWDERLTTKIANQAMFLTKTKQKDKKKKVDQIAAAIILQSYLDSRKKA